MSEEIGGGSVHWPIMYVITADQLRKAVPACRTPDTWVSPLNDAMLQYGISDRLDVVVEFLAQFFHETQNGNRLEENLNYSPERLMAVWPSRFRDLATATKYAGKPHALAEHVYGGRMGNRPEGSGDGWAYRGRAAGITGRDNYARVAKALNTPAILTCPDMLCTRVWAAKASAQFWQAHPKLTEWAIDTPTDDDYADFVSITKLINGGDIGLKERAKLRDGFKAALGC